MVNEMTDAGDKMKERVSGFGGPGVVLTEEQARSRRARNIAIGATIALLAVLFYAVTLVKFGAAIINRTL
ncbi:CoxF [Methylocystis sp. B8]|uniref:CoxF n=1 Tax=Methylocystis sp. B8 TaxID=544938 RepID=UPI001FEF3B94|nr:CoxF [Methylocystis sp. B8]